MSLLTPEEVAFYQANGYLLYHKQLFAAGKLAGLSKIFEEHLEQKGSLLSDELDRPHFRDDRLLEFLLSDEPLDLVEPLIGPNIALWSSHFISKEPYAGRATPWHEDSAFWKGRLSRYDQVITIWLAIDRSTSGNGCMRVIPGSHDNGFSEYMAADSKYNSFAAQITEVDESTAVDFELEPGECSLHDARIIHGARANRSPFRRCGYTMRYFSTSIKMYPEKNQDHKVWLARGKDLAGNVYENA